MAISMGLPPTSIEPTITTVTWPSRDDAAGQGALRVPSPFRGLRPGDIGSTEIPSGIPGAGVGAEGTPPVSFAERLRELVQDVDEVQRGSAQMSDDFANGKQHDIHGTMLSMQEADISLRFLSNVRSRLLEAYREIMRMGA